MFQTMKNISISQILVLPDITDVTGAQHFSVFSSAHVSSHASPQPFQPHAFTMFSTTLITPSTVIISDPTESRSWNCAHDRSSSLPRSRPWRGIFSPRVVLNAFLERTCCFCSVFLTKNLYIALYSSE